MKAFDNIETRKFPGQNHYVGYSSDGRSWRIHGYSGNWNATANLTRAGSMNLLVGLDRLQEISEELAKIK